MLYKKLLRTILKYKTQFISMLIMTMLGVGIFVGFNVEWYSIEKNTNIFYEETGFADYRVISSSGFSIDDVEKVEEEYESVTRFTSFNADVLSGDESKNDTISITSVENDNVSGFKLMNGNEYDSLSINGIWLSETYANSNNVKLNEEMIFSYNGITINGVVEGLIKSSEYMVSVKDETQIMPDYSIYGYAYVSSNLLSSVGCDFYSQIHVITNDDKITFTNKIENVLGFNNIILTKDECISYAGPQGEIEEGKIIATILPVLFLIISSLTMITTMSRITNNEITQIATLKALGFRDRKIINHYSIYPLIISFVGSIFGIGFGFILAYLIINPNGSMGTYLDMPYWNLYIPSICFTVLIGLLIFSFIVGIISIKKILRKSTLELLKGSSKGKVKALKIESTKFFQNRSFSFRWNLKDICNNKVRSLMSLFGVIGCMIILIAALGMSNSFDNFYETNYIDALNYETRIYLSDDISDEDTNELINKYDADTSATLAAKIEDKVISFDIYNIENNYLKFVGEDGNLSTINNNGVYVSSRVSNEFNLEVGDSFDILLYGTNTTVTLKVEGIIRTMIEGVVLTQDYAKSLNIDYKIDSLYTNDEVTIQDGIKSIQPKDELISTFDIMLEIMNMMILMFIVIGCILSIVVLYNLGVIGYTESYRDMATLKVLGFKDKQITKILITQNLWITLLGVILGIPIGNLALSLVVTSMNNQYEMIVQINSQSYIISVFLTVFVSLIVSMFLSRRNKDINMVEALKASE